MLKANQIIKPIDIDDELLSDKEQLKDYFKVTINKAIEKATIINKTEIAAHAKNGIPNIPAIDGTFK
ncbi:MAG: DNA-binding protein YbaB [Patiriisocius sp.]|jgi:DNA-binding protein YbaB